MPKNNLDKAFGKSNKEIKKLLGVNPKKLQEGLKSYKPKKRSK